MPELPEAETITRALDCVLKKRKIEKVEIFTPKLRTPLKPLCAAKLEGRAGTEGPLHPQDGVISQLQSNVYLNWFETCAALVAKVTNQ